VHYSDARPWVYVCHLVYSVKVLVWNAKCIIENPFEDVQVSDMAARVLGYVQQGYIVRARTDIDTIVRLRSNSWPYDWQGWCTGTTAVVSLAASIPQRGHGGLCCELSMHTGESCGFCLLVPRRKRGTARRLPSSKA